MLCTANTVETWTPFACPAILKVRSPHLHACAARRLQGHDGVARQAGLGAVLNPRATNHLNLFSQKSGHVVAGHDGRILRRDDLAGVRRGQRADGLGLGASASVQTNGLVGAYMVAVRVAQQHDMHIAKARITCAGD